MTKRTFDEALQIGLAGEDACLAFLKQVRGLFVQPRYAKGGERRGPRHHSADLGSVDLPSHDLDARYADRDFDIQVKTKTSATWRRDPPGPYYEQGFDTPVFDQYKAAWNATRKPVLVVFVELTMPSEGPGVAPKILAQWLDRMLSPRFCSPNRAFPHGGVFWERRKLVQVGESSVVPAIHIMAGDRTTIGAMLSDRFHMVRRDFRLVPTDESPFVPVTCAACGEILNGVGFNDGGKLYHALCWAVVEQREARG